MKIKLVELLIIALLICLVILVVWKAKDLVENPCINCLKAYDLDVCYCSNNDRPMQTFVIENPGRDDDLNP